MPVLIPFQLASEILLLWALLISQFIPTRTSQLQAVVYTRISRNVISYWGGIKSCWDGGSEFHWFQDGTRETHHCGQRIWGEYRLVGGWKTSQTIR